MIPIQQSNNSYNMRGSPVPFLSKEQIWAFAEVCKRALKINKHTRKKFGFFIEELQLRFSSSGLSIIPIDDIEWNGRWLPLNAQGKYEPNTNSIEIKESIFTAADQGSPNGIRVLMHEVAHFLLGHKHGLFILSDDFILCQEVDPEWQADELAAHLCTAMGVDYFSEEILQLSLF